MIELLPFTLFAFVASITPGPTNVLVLSHSVRFGLLGALPIVLGGCAGAALMVLTVGLGVGDAQPATDADERRRHPVAELPGLADLFDA